jgi:predicted O-methyltransferase YrrM
MIDSITQKYKDLPYMTHEQAMYMRDIILENKCQQLCELGTYLGKSATYFSAILKEQGYGKLTTFDLTYPERKFTIEQLLKEFDLVEYVKVVKSVGGYTWDLAEMILNNVDEKFDFCYIDGGHTFLHTGMGFVLVDILMKPGGIVVFDDVYWTVENNPTAFVNIKVMSDEEKAVAGVKRVCDTIVANRNYELIDDVNKFNWLVYRKNAGFV